jgi:hypothetical protein
VALIVILIVLSLLFGGFQKGTKSSGFAPLSYLCPSCTSAPMAARAGPGQ